jgi:hypothetical protein
LIASYAARIDGTSGLRSRITVGPGTNEDDPERQYRDRLLELHAAVHCDEHIVMTSHAAQQFAVLDPRPAATRHRIHDVTGEFRG